MVRPGGKPTPRAARGVSVILPSGPQSTHARIPHYAAERGETRAASLGATHLRLLWNPTVSHARRTAEPTGTAIRIYGDFRAVQRRCGDAGLIGAVEISLSNCAPSPPHQRGRLLEYRLGGRARARAWVFRSSPTNHALVLCDPSTARGAGGGVTATETSVRKGAPLPHLPPLAERERERARNPKLVGWLDAIAHVL